MDEITEFAIDHLLSGAGARALPLALVRYTPQMPALELVLILSITASSIESLFDSANMLALAGDTWRMAALIGVDLHMMQQLGLAAVTGADLLHYWQTEDGFFLTEPTSR